MTTKAGKAAKKMPTTPIANASNRPESREGAIARLTNVRILGQNFYSAYEDLMQSESIAELMKAEEEIAMLKRTVAEKDATLKRTVSEKDATIEQYKMLVRDKDGANKSYLEHFLSKEKERDTKEEEYRQKIAQTKALFEQQYSKMMERSKKEVDAIRKSEQNSRDKIEDLEDQLDTTTKKLTKSQSELNRLKDSVGFLDPNHTLYGLFHC
jgi:chromosome segregation ATPase